MHYHVSNLLKRAVFCLVLVSTMTLQGARAKPIVFITGIKNCIQKSFHFSRRPLAIIGAGTLGALGGYQAYRHPFAFAIASAGALGGYTAYRYYLAPTFAPKKSITPTRRPLPQSFEESQSIEELKEMVINQIPLTQEKIDERKKALYPTNDYTKEPIDARYNSIEPKKSLTPEEYRTCLYDIFIFVSSSQIAYKTSELIKFLKHNPEAFLLCNNDGKTLFYYLTKRRYNGGDPLSDLNKISFGRIDEAHLKKPFEEFLYRATHQVGKDFFTPLENAILTGEATIAKNLLFLTANKNREFGGLFHLLDTENKRIDLIIDYISNASAHALKAFASHEGAQKFITFICNTLEIPQYLFVIITASSKKAKYSIFDYVLKNNNDQFFTKAKEACAFIPNHRPESLIESYLLPSSLYAPIKRFRPDVFMATLFRKNYFLQSVEYKCTKKTIQSLAQFYGKPYTIALINLKSWWGASPIILAFYKNHGNTFCEGLKAAGLCFDDVKNALEEAYQWNKTYRPDNPALNSISTPEKRKVFWNSLTNDIE